MNDACPLRVAVIGGGISGLAAAHRITELAADAEVDLYDAGPRLGGTLQTEQRDGYLVEYGADNFITTIPWGLDFCRRIGFEDQLIPTSGPHRRAFVVRRGKLEPIPEGFMLMAPGRIGPILTTPILSPWGKLRMAAELLVPKRAAADDESLASFVTRRLGREAYERLVQPLISGIYTADPDLLSLGSTMPQFLKMEQEHGSLIRAMWARRKSQTGPQRKEQASGARYSQFVAPKHGMSTFVEAITQKLGSVRTHLQAPIEDLTPNAESNQWTVRIGGSEPQQTTVDAVVMAIPAHRAAQLLRPTDASIADALNQIGYASSGLISFGYQRQQIRHALDGFGFVVPLIEQRQILSASFSSIKYTGRAPDGSVMMRAYVGGACQAELLEKDDEQLLEMAKQELTQLLGIEGEPQLAHIHRCIRAMPQYHVGHQALVGRIVDQAKKHPGLVLAGNWMHGVGIPHCVHTAEDAIESMLANRTPVAATSE